MLKRERQAYIVHQVKVHNKVLSTTLSAEIDVSEDTIRRDLQELSDKGKLIKVHGGALSHSFHKQNPSSQNVYAHQSKKIIAGKAVKLIQDGMFVLTGGGTTIIELAKNLPADLAATFISGSIPAINEYMHHPKSDVIVIGDKLSKSSMITYGADAMARLETLKPDLCFLGVNALDPENGITDNDWDVVQLKKAMIASAQKLVCLTISEKIDTVQPIQVCDLSKIDILITELQPDDAILEPYLTAGIEII